MKLLVTTPVTLLFITIWSISNNTVIVAKKRLRIKTTQRNNNNIENQNDTITQNEFDSGDTTTPPPLFKVGTKHNITISSNITASEIAPQHSSLKSSSSSSNNNTTTHRRNYTLEHKGASYLSVHFRDLNLPPNCWMVLSSPSFQLKTSRRDDDVEILRGRGKHDMGSFWARHVPGDIISIILDCSTNNDNDDDDVDATVAYFEIDEYVSGYPTAPHDWNEDVNDSNHPAFTYHNQQNTRKMTICEQDDKRNAICYAQTNPLVYSHSRSVARLLVNGISSCTGFLISSSVLLTNEHCIKTREDVWNTDFEFMGEEDTCESQSGDCWMCQRGVVFDGADLLVVDAGLDLAVVRLSGEPGVWFGFLQLDNGNPPTNHPIYIPQHPAGRAKEIALLSSSSTCRLTGTSPGCTSKSYRDVTYSCDTEGGSSGAPVLSRSNHKVIGLHHCGGVCKNRAVPVWVFYDVVAPYLVTEAPTAAPTRKPVTEGPTAGPSERPATAVPTEVPSGGPTMGCVGGEGLFRLELRLDPYPEESSWTLHRRYPTPTLVSSGDNYDAAELIREQICLIDDCYRFTMIDSYGDGLAIGAYYNVYYDRILVGSGREFKKSIDVDFGVCASESPSVPPTISHSINPTLSMIPSSSPSIVPTMSLIPTTSEPSRSARPSVRPSSSPSASVLPTSLPSTRPSASILPSLHPSIGPSVTLLPTSSPSFRPSLSSSPSRGPSTRPSNSLHPSASPSFQPSVSPTHAPSYHPTSSTVPSAAPSEEPTLQPSMMPSESIVPSVAPSEEPSRSVRPSSQPSMIPSESLSPTATPSSKPSHSTIPSFQPSVTPSGKPSMIPSVSPSISSHPSNSPTLTHTPSQSVIPSSLPSLPPTISAHPTTHPTVTPSRSVMPSGVPSTRPSGSLYPTNAPSLSVGPTVNPTMSPSRSISPTSDPSNRPSGSTIPSGVPSTRPSNSVYPTDVPSLSTLPTLDPTSHPTLSGQPSVVPTERPSVSTMPSESPTALPTMSPTESQLPTLLPTTNPTLSILPTSSPTNTPSVSTMPSELPTASPTISPTRSGSPTFAPTSHPSLSVKPSVVPSKRPSNSLYPTNTPTIAPTSLPSNNPTQSQNPSVSHSTTPSTTGRPSTIPTTSTHPSPTPSLSQRPSTTPCVPFNLSLKTDYYGEETTWRLQRGVPNVTVISGGPYVKNIITTDTATACLVEGNYTFTIDDSYGDGLCCKHGKGSFKLFLNGERFYRGGGFEDRDEVTFDVSLP